MVDGMSSLAWNGTAWYMARHGTHGMMHAMVCYDMACHGTVRCGTVRYGTARHGTVRCGTVRYGMVRYHMAWHGIDKGCLLQVSLQRP